MKYIKILFLVLFPLIANTQNVRGVDIPTRSIGTALFNQNPNISGYAPHKGILSFDISRFQFMYWDSTANIWQDYNIADLDNDPTNELFDSTYIYAALIDSSASIRLDFPTGFSGLYNDLDFTGTTGMSDGIDNVDDLDNNPTNEIQDTSEIVALQEFVENHSINVEADPQFSASVANDITAIDTINWNRDTSTTNELDSKWAETTTDTLEPIKNVVRIQGTTYLDGKLLDSDGELAGDNQVMGSKANGDADWVDVYSGYSISSLAPDTSILWINTNIDDGTGVFAVQDYVNNEWATIEYWDSVNEVFSYHLPLYFLTSGQSNMTPRNPGGDISSSDFVSVYDPLLGIWRKLENNLSFLNPASATSNFIPLHIGKAASIEDGRIVRIVHHAIGGRPISDWTQGTKPIYTELVSRANSSGINKFDAFFWYQGESDGVNTNAYYYDQFINELYNNQLINETWFDKQTIVLCAEINATQTGVDFQNNVIRTFSNDSLNFISYVPTKDLPSPDGQHLTGEAYQELGERFYQYYKSMPYHPRTGAGSPWKLYGTSGGTETTQWISELSHNGNVSIGSEDGSSSFTKVDLAGSPFISQKSNGNTNATIAIASTNSDNDTLTITKNNGDREIYGHLEVFNEENSFFATNSTFVSSPVGSKKMGTSYWRITGSLGGGVGTAREAHFKTDILDNSGLNRGVLHIEGLNWSSAMSPYLIDIKLTKGRPLVSQLYNSSDAYYTVSKYVSSDGFLTIKLEWIQADTSPTNESISIATDFNSFNPAITNDEVGVIAAKSIIAGGGDY